MTTFKSPHNNRTVTIRQHEDGHGIVVKADSGPAFASVYLDPTDDAAIALAVMEAAAQDTLDCEPGSANHARELAINWLMTARDRAAKEADATKREVARNKRRDELATEVERTGFTYNDLCGSTRRAVDLLIDREEAKL